MDYARVLLMVLWQDCCFLLVGVAVMAALLVPAAGVIALMVYRVYDGVPLRILALGTAYGWFSGVVGGVGVLLAVVLLNPDMLWSPYQVGPTGGMLLILYAAMSVIAAAQAFQYVEHHYNRREETRPRKRFAFTLRSLVILQVALCVAIGWWASSRRTAIAQHYAHVQLQRQEADAEQRFGHFGWHPRVVLLSANRGQTQLELYLYDHETLQGFDDDVLKKIQPADDIQLLQVNSPNLTDNGLATIGKLRSLRQLSLRSDQITDAGLAHLKQLPDLVELSLESDQLTLEGLKQLQDFPALQRLTIVSNMGAEREHDLKNQLSRMGVYLLLLRRSGR